MWKHEKLVLDWRNKPKAKADVRLTIEKAFDAGLPDTSQDYADQPTDPEEHIATRLGDAPVTVITPDLLSPFTSDQIECLPFPWSWMSTTLSLPL